MMKLKLETNFNTYFTDRKYRMMMIRRRFVRRLFICLFIFGGSFYLSMLLFGDLKSSRVPSLTELDRCPACYGVSVCPELYSDRIILDNEGWTKYFNVKNVYYGYTKSNRRIVLKKLAHDSELKELDANFCKYWNLRPTCKTMDVMNVSKLAIHEEVIKLVAYNFTYYTEMSPRKGLVMCPYPFSFYDFVQPLLNGLPNLKLDMMYIWTMLKINPEPIVLKAIPKSKGWPVPAYAGVCGRVELVAYEGEPLSSLLHVKWHKRLAYAKKILDAAMDFTYKHDRFRFYLMDWSLDNIVVNNKDEVVTFVDLEDVVVLDKHISPKKDLPDWYERYSREFIGFDFTFSIENMCKHHLSDHNLWAACYIFAGPDRPLLYPLPKHISNKRPKLNELLQYCLLEGDRFNTVTQLQTLFYEILRDYSVVG